MVIISKLIVPLIFLAATSVAQSTDEIYITMTDQQRWPLQFQCDQEHENAKEDSELKIILYREAPVGQVMPLEQIQEMVTKLPWNAEGNYLEVNFTLRSETDESRETELGIYELISRFEQAFMIIYFPQENKNNFDAAMQPLKDYFNLLTPSMIENSSTEQVKDEYEKAWKLLRTALRR